MRKQRIAVVVIALAVIGVGAWWLTRGDVAPPVAVQSAPRASEPVPKLAVPGAARPAEIAIVSPGQGKAVAAVAAAPGGSVTGQVINWSSGEGVPGADLVFIGDDGALTVRSGAGGVFALAPTAPGRFTLAAATAPGYLPFAPELSHSNVHLALARDHTVTGVTVFLFPALDYHGTVVDATGIPVAGAHVQLLGTSAGEQRSDEAGTEWTTDGKGEFGFHAADDAVLEATHGTARGAARLDGNVAITKQLIIKLAAAAPARDGAIAGHVTSTAGEPLADVLVRAVPSDETRTVAATAFATSGPDGAFVFPGLERTAYDLTAEADGFAYSAPIYVQASGPAARDAKLVLDPGAVIAGAVTTAKGAVVPAYTLLAYRRAGAGRELVAARSVVDAAGAFEIHVAPGDYELTASAAGWAPSPATVAQAGERAVKLVVAAGAVLHGRVTSAAGSVPVPYARVTREARSGGASAAPANAGTVTRADGTFELTGIPAGAVSVTVAADHFHPRIVAGMTATDGAELPATEIALTPLLAGELPVLELVGIGVALAPDGDALRVTRVIPGSGAQAAGIELGDEVVTVDGAATAELGVDGAVAKIRGTEGTLVAIGLRRGEQVVTLSVERRKLKA